MSYRARLPGLVALVLFILALVLRKGDMAWMASIFVAYLAAGALLSPSEKMIVLCSRRSAREFRRGEETFVDVSLWIRNNGPRTLFARVSDPISPTMRIVVGTSALCAALSPGEETTQSYTFRADRGVYSWKGLAAAVGDPFGLFETEVEVDSGADLIIQPRLERMKPIAVRAQHTLSSPGLIPTKAGGLGTDFWGVREYQQGDPLKFLDWRLSARHPHHFFTREFVVERTTEYTLILDGRAGTDMTVGEESVFEIEVRAVASICELFLRQAHRVGLIVARKRSLRVPPDFGRVQLRRILNCLGRSGIDTSTKRDSLYRLPLGKVSQASTIVIVSPIDSEDIAFFRRLRAQDHEVVLICPNLLASTDSVETKDKARRLALRAARLERRINLNLISQLSVKVVDWPLDRPLWPLLRIALGQRSRPG